MSTVGCKVLTRDLRSLHRGDFQYSREWRDVPGNGAYVAIDGDLDAGGDVSAGVLVFLECERPICADDAPTGVRCFGRVRIVDDCWALISPALRACVASCAPLLSAAVLQLLAADPDLDVRRRVAGNASTPADVLQLLAADHA